MREKILKTTLILLTLAPIVFATDGTLPNNLPSNIWDVVQNIVKILLAVIFVLAVIAIVVAGVMYITAGGDPGKVEAAKNVLFYTVIGVGIAGLAWALMILVYNVLIGWTPK